MPHLPNVLTHSDVPDDADQHAAKRWRRKTDDGADATAYQYSSDEDDLVHHESETTDTLLGLQLLKDFDDQRI